MSNLPFANIRVIELSQTLAGRLSGQLLADQGAEVFMASPSNKTNATGADAFLNRGKTMLPALNDSDLAFADVLIVDAAYKGIPNPEQRCGPLGCKLYFGEHEGFSP